MKECDYTDSEIIEMIRNGGKDLEIAMYCLLIKEKISNYYTKSIRMKGAKDEDCEEITNDALIALNTSIRLGRFDYSRKIAPYIRGTVQKMWYKRIRDNKDATIEIPYDIRDDQKSIEEKIIAGERRAGLLKLLEQLSEKCQRILKLAFFEEMTNEEIALKEGYKSKAIVAVKKSECLKKLGGMDFPDNE